MRERGGMNDILLEQVLKRLNEAAMELHSQIKTDNEQQMLKTKAEQDKQTVIERNHEDIKAAGNKEILRKQLELMTEYSRLPEVYEHIAECSNAHVFYGHGLRQLSEQYGMVATLCWKCHRGGRGVHLNHELDLELKQLFQQKFEETHSRQAFMAIFGRNWL